MNFAAAGTRNDVDRWVFSHAVTPSAVRGFACTVVSTDCAAPDDAATVVNCSTVPKKRVGKPWMPKLCAMEGLATQSTRHTSTSLVELRALNVAPIRSRSGAKC